MSYRIEFAQSFDEAFFQEIALIDRYTQGPQDLSGVNHQFNIYADRREYGEWGWAGQTIASNANGMIVSPRPGTLQINIPPSAFFGQTDVGTGIWIGGFDRRSSIRCRLSAVPLDATQAKTLFTGLIKFGERAMPPRLTLEVYPFYPAVNTPDVTATQIKIQLSKIPAQYDLVEAALPGPTDPATITWNTGGLVTIGGPLSNVIAGALGYDATAMQVFLIAAAANPT